MRKTLIKLFYNIHRNLLKSAFNKGYTNYSDISFFKRMTAKFSIKMYNKLINANASDKTGFRPASFDYTDNLKAILASNSIYKDKSKDRNLIGE